MSLQGILQEACQLFFCIGYFVGEERVKLQGKTDASVLHYSKRTANGELRDVVHRPYQGNLYLQNVIRFHCTRVNVISVKPIRKIGLLHRFSRISQMPNDVNVEFPYPVLTMSDNKCGM